MLLLPDVSFHNFSNSSSIKNRMLSDVTHSLGFPSAITESLVQEFEPMGGVLPKSLVPAERLGREEEMVGTILYLASKAGAYCNGSIALVDGGVLALHPSSY